MVENFDKFDKWLVICQSFPTKLFYLNVSPMKPTINLLKFCLSKYHVARPHWSNFCAIQKQH